MLRGHAWVMGRVAMQKRRSAVESGKSAITKKTGVCTWAEAGGQYANAGVELGEGRTEGAPCHQDELLGCVGFSE